PTTHPFTSFFFFTLHPPPRSTLFPYTTLFRSQNGRMQNSQMTNYIMPTSSDLPPIRVFFEELGNIHGAFGAKGIGELPMEHPDRDRKSTRLNSSHVAISYAVFCLKKKSKK